MSYNKALTTFGLNADLAGITSAFLAGGFTGIDKTFSLTSAFSSLTIEGVRYAGRELNLDPTITNIIGMSAATIVSAGLGGVEYYDIDLDETIPLTGLDAISYTIGTTVLPNVTSELAYYGITKLGDMLGISEISMIAGMGIRSTISASFRGYDANDIFRTAIGGMSQGIVSLGINYATQELGLNQLLANMGFSAIASALNAGITAATGGSQDVFGTFYNTYINNALTFLGYGNTTDPNYLWLESSYKTSIIDFSDIVRRTDGIDGLIDALNTYGVSFFNSTTVGALTKSGLTIGKYFADKLSEGQSTDRVLPNDTVVKQVAVKDGDTTIANVLFEEKQDGASFYWDIVGVEYLTDEATYLSYGDMGLDSYAKLGFTDAELYSAFDSDIQFQRIINGEQAYAELKDLSGNTLLVIEPTEIGGYNFYNNHGDYVDAKIREFSDGYDITIKNSDIGRYLLNGVNWLSDDQVAALQNAGYSDSDINMLALNIGFSIDSSGNLRLQYGLTPDTQMLSDVAGILGSNWLTDLKLDGDIFYYVNSYLLDTASYSKNTRILGNTEEGIAAVDMFKLNIFESEEYKKYVFPLAFLLGKIGYENTIWDMSVKDAAPEVSNLLNTTSMKFVYVPGNRTDVNDLSQVRQMCDMLGTDKRVVVGESAGTEAVIRAWATIADKSVYYILISPRMTAEALNTYATQAGIDPSKILIVNAKNDWVDWSWGYGRGAPSNPHPWTHVFLTKDITAPDNELLGHGGPIEGWLNNHSYNIAINRDGIENNQSLIRIYQRFLNGDLWQS